MGGVGSREPTRLARCADENSYLDLSGDFGKARFRIRLLNHSG